MVVQAGRLALDALPSPRFDFGKEWVSRRDVGRLDLVGVSKNLVDDAVERWRSVKDCVLWLVFLRRM
jgi:hypothetical protein